MQDLGVASADLRASDANKRARKSTVFDIPRSRALTLQNWPVSWRLIAVIVLTAVMGLVFGGLRVAAAARTGRKRHQPAGDDHRPG